MGMQIPSSCSWQPSCSYLGTRRAGAEDGGGHHYSPGYLVGEGEILVLTPANADEHPLAELVRGVGENDGRVQVAALAEHPKKVGDMEVIVGSSDQAAPDLPRVLRGDVEGEEQSSVLTVVKPIHRATQTAAEQLNPCSL